MKLRYVNQQSFSAEVLESPVPVLLDFFADWCPPCQKLTPVLEKLAEEYAGRVDIVKIDIEADPELADQFQVSSIPTLVTIVNGQMAKRTVGLLPEASLRDTLNQAIEAASQSA